MFRAKIILPIIFLSCWSGICQAQTNKIYLDGCFNMDYFTNLEGFEIERPQLSWAFRTGWGFAINQAKNLALHTEFGFSRRKLVRTFPGQEYRYAFNGLDFSSLLAYAPAPVLWLEAGVGLSFFYWTFDYENKRAGIGEGLQNFDVLLHAGGNVKVYKSIHLGSRVRYGLIPVLHYTPINDLGGFDDEVRIVNALTHEIYLRINFYYQ